MKTYKNLLMMAVWAIATTACTQDAELPAPANDDRPLVVTATLPVQAWGVESRAEDDEITDLTLHYYKVGETATTTFLIQEYTCNEDGAISFTTKAGSGENDKPLVWSQIAKDDGMSTFYLTAVKDDVVYWATATVSHNSDEITFENEMKPRKARFTVVLTVNGNIQLAENSFSFTLSDVKDAAEIAADVTVQDWPTVVDEDSKDYIWGNVTFDLTDKTYTVTNDFAPQTVGDLSIAFGDFNWTVDLSELSLKDDNGNPRTENANEFKAGEHIKIAVTVTLDELKEPSIEIASFTQVEETLNGEVQPNTEENEEE